MTADAELERVVAWLRGYAEDRRFWQVSLWLRCKCAWTTFRYPHGIASSSVHLAADALTRHEHRSEADG